MQFEIIRSSAVHALSENTEALLAHIAMLRCLKDKRFTQSLNTLARMVRKLDLEKGMSCNAPLLHGRDLYQDCLPHRGSTAHVLRYEIHPTCHLAIAELKFPMKRLGREHFGTVPSSARLEALSQVIACGAGSALTADRVPFLGPTAQNPLRTHATDGNQPSWSIALYALDRSGKRIAGVGLTGQGNHATQVAAITGVAWPKAKMGAHPS